MAFGSKGLALILALCISVITTSFLSLVEGIQFNALILAFILSFSSGYLLGYIILEFLIFREISQINESFEELKKTNPIQTNDSNNPLSPFRQMKKELYSFAEDKQQEIEELRRLEHFRREFLADVSHELKTPIFAAQGFIHTLMDGALKDKKVRDKFLKKAAKSLDGLDELVHDLLVISQMESGEITMHQDDFDIKELFDEIIDQFEDKAGKKRIAINYAENTGSTYVRADARRIRQVVTNLISNAVKYTEDEKGDILISFDSDENEVRISVKDSGVGIPSDHMNRIFERFYRIDKSRSKGKGGSGLGLAIVKHIVEAHNGKIEVASTVGEGSTFTFNLAAGKPSRRNEEEEAQEFK